MDSSRLKEILATFTDDRQGLVLEKGRLVAQVHGELIEATTQMREGSLMITEEGREWPAVQWLVYRIARLDLLAERIIATHPGQPAFVVPKAEFVDLIDRDPKQTPNPVDDAVSTLQGFLERRPGGSCSVLYLTSDAGEGKTTIIAELSHRQAHAFRRRLSNWLLVPISLGGECS